MAEPAAKQQPELPAIKTLPALQKNIDEICTYFGWYDNNNERTFMLFVEEVGELAKAIRKAMKIEVEVGQEQSEERIQQNLQEEFADCLNYLMDLANRFNVDLETAYINKMNSNFQRTWRR